MSLRPLLVRKIQEFGLVEKYNNIKPENQLRTILNLPQCLTFLPPADVDISPELDNLFNYFETTCVGELVKRSRV